MSKIIFIIKCSDILSCLVRMLFLSYENLQSLETLFLISATTLGVYRNDN